MGLVVSRSYLHQRTEHRCPTLLAFPQYAPPQHAEGHRLISDPECCTVDPHRHTVTLHVKRNGYVCALPIAVEQVPKGFKAAQLCLLKPVHMLIERVLRLRVFTLDPIL